MKNLLLNCSLIVFLFVSCKKLTVGESYKGGKIAYIDASGKHGLIAAPNDMTAFVALPGVEPGTVQWGCYGTEISGADGTAIGTGSQNTIDIMNGCNEAGIAARICGDLVFGSYSDWYLPSLDELNQLYINRVAVGGFASGGYWSSTEGGPFGSGGAWIQNFLVGYQFGGGKDYYLGVRAVRSF